MVGVQVTLALVEALSQLGQHLVHWWWAQPELPEVLDQIRFPPAVNASPLIADEAKNPKAPMLGVVTAGCRTTTLCVLLAGYGSLVFRAVSTLAKPSASGLATRATGKITHPQLTVLPDGGDSLGHPQEERHYRNDDPNKADHPDRHRPARRDSR
jgi:hypothetical protein